MGRMDPSADTDRSSARVARAQYGILTRRQLRCAGLSDQQVKDRVLAGRLIRLHRGVCALGYGPITREGRRLAAVFACGDGAVVSHLTAATSWDLWPSAHATIDVTIPNRFEERLLRLLDDAACPVRS